jgi:hypothetical protein
VSALGREKNKGKGKQFYQYAQASLLLLNLALQHNVLNFFFLKEKEYTEQGYTITLKMAMHLFWSIVNTKTEPEHMW